MDADAKLFNKTISQAYRELQLKKSKTIVYINIYDHEFEDEYQIKMQKTTAGIGILCRLNGQLSYQAQANSAGGSRVYEIINDIAAGKIANAKGWI